MEHTPTPWRVSRANPSPTTGEWMIAGSSNGYLAEVRDCGGGSVAANARRIVAAINYCQGLPTEGMEVATRLGKTVEVSLQQLVDAIEQRDQLQSKLEAERASLFAENQRKQQLEQQVAELVGALENVMPWVVAQEVACHGLKCREPVCMSCSSDSEEAAEKATYAYEEARAVIQKVRGGEC